MKTGTLLAVALLSLVALAHLARVVLGVEVIVDGYRVPMYLSVIGVVVPAAIVVLLVRESRAGA